jgi:hypothetical protein
MHDQDNPGSQDHRFLKDVNYRTTRSKLVTGLSVPLRSFLPRFHLTSPPTTLPTSQLVNMDPLTERQRRRYQAQHDTITTKFQATGGDLNTNSWRLLGIRLERALSDATLPSHHRVSYHLIYAWCVSDPLLQIERAREAIHNMARDLQAAGKAPWEVDRFLEGAWKVLAVVEGSVKEQIEEKKARKEKYANLLLDARSWRRRLLTVFKGIRGCG